MTHPIRNLFIVGFGWLFVCQQLHSATLYTGPWDIPALQKTAVAPEWSEVVGKSREVYFPGEPYQGKSTRVFAYYSKPEGKGPFPAMVLVHGGGGKAFREWAEHWSKRGYAAIAMDLAGHGPKGKLADGGPDQSDETKFRDFDEKTIRDMWTYHALTAIIRAHNLIRDLPEVDKDRTGVTGISWGGYLTCIVAGLDDRFKVAVPVYGCGFLHENSVWKKTRFEKMPEAQQTKWVNAFDPSKYLVNVKTPILFLNGTNDFAYPMDSYLKCYQLVPGEKYLSMRVRLPHGHIWTFPEVDQFVGHYLNNEPAFPVISSPVRNELNVLATVKSVKAPAKAQLHYATPTGAWSQREWKSIPAEYKDGTIQAKLPSDAAIVYYFSITTESGVEVSSTHDQRVP